MQILTSPKLFQISDKDDQAETFQGFSASTPASFIIISLIIIIILAVHATAISLL